MKTICFHILTRLFPLSPTQLKFPLGTWIKYFPFDKHKIYWFIGCSDKESACQCRRRRFNPWVRKIPWKRNRQHTSVLSPGKFHGQRSLVGDSPWGRKRVGYDLATKQQQNAKPNPRGFCFSFPVHSLCVQFIRTGLEDCFFLYETPF